MFVHYFSGLRISKGTTLSGFGDSLQDIYGAFVIGFLKQYIMLSTGSCKTVGVLTSNTSYNGILCNSEAVRYQFLLLTYTAVSLTSNPFSIIELSGLYLWFIIVVCVFLPVHRKGDRKA